MKQFEQGRVQKHYLCVVDVMNPTTETDLSSLKHILDSRSGQFIVDAPIQRHSEVAFVREVGHDRDDSKHASTSFQIMGASPNGSMMVLQARPKTGRTHQIRVHARHAGLPIVGDDLYNPKEHAMYIDYAEISRAAQDPSLTKYADDNALRKGLKLHAWKITLLDPSKNFLPITFTANPPTHMAELINAAGMTLDLTQ